MPYQAANEITKAYAGSDEVKKIYVGSDLVYSKYLSETTTFETNVNGDGGTVEDIDFLDTVLRDAKDDSWYNDIVFMIAPEFGYKTSGSDITKIYDASGNVYDAQSDASLGDPELQTSSDFNNKKIISFDGVDEMFRNDSVASDLNNDSDMTIIQVKQEVTPLQNGSPWAVTHFDSVGVGLQYKEELLYATYDRLTYFQTWNADQSSYRAGYQEPFPTIEPVVQVTINVADTSIECWRNNSLLDEDSGGSPAVAWDETGLTLEYFTVGCSHRDNAIRNFYKGEIAFLAIVNKDIGTTARTNIQTTLANHYGITI